MPVQCLAKRNRSCHPRSQLLSRTPSVERVECIPPLLFGSVVFYWGQENNQEKEEDSTISMLIVGGNQHAFFARFFISPLFWGVLIRLRD